MRRMEPTALNDSSPSRSRAEPVASSPRLISSVPSRQAAQLFQKVSRSAATSPFSLASDVAARARSPVMSATGQTALPRTKQTESL